MREGIVWSNDFFVSCQDQSLPNSICIGLRSFVSCITKTAFLHCDLWTLLDTWRLWFYGLFSVHLILYCQTLSVISYLGDFTHRSDNYWATDVDNQKDFQQRVLLLIKHKIRMHLITLRSRQNNEKAIVNVKWDSGKIPKHISFYFICLLICWHCIIDESSKKVCFCCLKQMK